MSGNRASKANVILSTECCCGVSLGLKSDTIGGHETLVSEGLCPFCWHCLVMARAGGSLLLPSPVSLSPAQIQPGAGVPGAPVCCDPSMYTASGGRSPDLPPLWWSCPAGSQGAMSPSPDLVTCRVMFRLTEHPSDLQVLQAHTSVGLSWGRAGSAAPWKHHVSSGMGAQHPWL